MQSESWQKGSTGSLETSGGSGGSRSGPAQPSGAAKSEYPFALALRLKVVQIVCGIGLVVMGSVAAIEERGQFNLSLGVPAGAITVLAAGWSVHRSIGGSGKGSKGCQWCTRLLCLIACTLQCTLLVLTVRSLLHRHQFGAEHTTNTSIGVAATQGIFVICALCATALSVRVRFIHGPAPGTLPSRNARYPRSTSHTAVSMVPLASNFFGTSTTNEVSIAKNESDNEVVEVSIRDVKQCTDSSPQEERKKNENAKVTIANNNFAPKMNNSSMEANMPNGTEKNAM